MGDPFSFLAEEEGLSPTNFLTWLFAILLLVGLVFGSLIYNETKGGGGGGSSPTSTEDHHHGPGGEEIPVFP